MQTSVSVMASSKNVIYRSIDFGKSFVRRISRTGLNLGDDFRIFISFHFPDSKLYLFEKGLSGLEWVHVPQQHSRLQKGQYYFVNFGHSPTIPDYFRSFRRLPRFPEDCQRFPKNAEDVRRSKKVVAPVYSHVKGIFLTVYRYDFLH